MKSFRRLGWSDRRVVVCLITLAIALLLAATVQAASQYEYDCKGCHQMPPLDSDNGARYPFNGAVKGNHQSHSGATAATCVKCHGPELTSTGHRDKRIQVQGNINSSPKGSTYNRTFINQTSVPPNPLGSCSNSNCHFEADSPTWGRKPAYQVPADCGGCHLMTPASGNHSGHANVYGSETGACAKCHPDHANEGLPFRHATSATSRGIHVTFQGSPKSGGSYSGDGLNFLPSQGKTSFGGCNGTYCHSNGNSGAPNVPATWGGGRMPLDCTGCHDGNLNSGKPIASGSHGKHINNASFVSGANLGTNYSCARCHNTTVSAGSDVTVTNGGNHVDGFKNVAFNDGGSWDNGTCSSTMCHSAGKSGIPQPQAPSWGGAALDCKGCHGLSSRYGEPDYTNAGPGLELANSHSEKHLSNASSCVDCHATTTGDGVSIINGSTAHTDGAITVRFPGSYDLGGAAYDGALNAKTCSNTYCHSDGNSGPALENTKWGGKTSCRSCHGGDAASGTAVATYAHPAHLNNYTSLGRGNNLMCAECHAKTIGFANNTTLTDAAKHINRFKDYSGVRAGGSANYSTGTKVCSNVYCHSSGEKVPAFRNMTGSKAWDGNAKLGCDGCHGYGAGTFAPVAGEPNYGTRNGAENSHYMHTSGANMADSRGCAICHRTTVDRGVKNKMRDYSSAHLNGARDVSFAVIANYSGSYSAGDKRCSNTYCHGAGKSAAWGAGHQLCDSCHAAGSTLAGRHGAHWEGTGMATSYTAAPGNPTGSATKYNFECSTCHKGAHAQGPTIYNNNAAEVFFSYTSNGLSGSYDYGTQTALDGTLQWSNGKCNNTYCHSKGDGSEGYDTAGMTWSSAPKSLRCNGCHGGDYSKPNPINTDLHRNHLDTVSNASLGAGNGRRCADCHALTAAFANNSTVVDKRRHVNKFKDYSGALAGGSSTYKQDKTCDNNYCHSNGKKGSAYQFKPLGAWNVQATLGCNGCHGDAADPDFTTDSFGTPNYKGGAEGTDGANSHKLHLQKMPYSSSNVCYVCHARTIDRYADRQFRPYSTTHLSDGSTHVTFGKISTAGFKLMSSVGKARYSGKTCSTVTCHSDGKGGYQSVKWGAVSNCAMCHPLNKLSRGHSFHIYTSAVNNPTSYDNYTANRSTGTRYNYGCGNCHPLNNPNHTKGTVLIDLKPGDPNVVGALRSRNDAGSISVGGVVPGTAGSGTSFSGNDLFCANVYCHSNGYPTKLVYAQIPGWYNGSFSGTDRCASCHGNSPNSGGIDGSPSHYNNTWLGNDGAQGGHIIGIHATTITNGVNFNGLLTPGTTDPSSHGQTPTVTPTTIGCNTCHYSVITTSANDSSAQCSGCHNAAPKGKAFIADKSLHVNGSVSVQFRPNTNLLSKAQLGDVMFAPISSAYMKRINGYKNANSYDESKIPLSAGSYAGNGGNCTTVCHFNKPVRWDNVPAATCASCHQALGQ